MAHRSFVVAALVAAAATPAFADLTYLTQTRTVNGPGTAPITSPGFGPFNQSAFAGSFGSASQTSTLGPDGISYTGAATAGRDRVSGSWQYFTASSLLDVTFSITNPTPYIATASASGGNTWTATVRLLSLPSNTIVFDGASSSGLLAPGSYRALFSVSATGDSQVISGQPSINWPALNGQGNLSVNLNIPSPGAAALLGLGAALGASRRRRV